VLLLVLKLWSLAYHLVDWYQVSIQQTQVMPTGDPTSLYFFGDGYSQEKLLLHQPEFGINRVINGGTAEFRSLGR